MFIAVQKDNDPGTELKDIYTYRNNMITNSFTNCSSSTVHLPYNRDPLNFEIIYNYPPANHIPLVDINSFPNFGNISPTGIYIHIPFCSNTCSYCHYTRKKLENFNEIDNYIEAIQIEIQNWHKLIAIESEKYIKTIFLGGGTPTILTKNQIIKLISYINKFFLTHNLNKLEEFTWEASPETIIGINKEKLKILFDSGVNRLSIGVQSFNDRLLRLCERSHTKDQAVVAFETARNAGFININIDIIFGIPNQSISDWIATINDTISLSPESVTIHQLRIKQNTPIFEKLSKTSLKFLNQKNCFDMLQLAHKLFSEAGYIAIENDVFVKNTLDHYHKHQKNKWVKFEDLLGIGASAYGYLNNISYFNYLTKKQYYESIKSGQLPIWRSKLLTLQERKARSMVLGLTFYEGISKEFYRINFNENIEESYSELLNKLINNGLIEITDQHIRLTQKGGWISPEIRKEFYLKEHRNGPGTFGSYFQDFKFD